MASSATSRVLSGYRRLFRARKILFTGDVRAMAESRIAIRAEFDKNRNVADPQHLEGLLTMIDEAEDMLLNGIVRGMYNLMFAVSIMRQIKMSRSVIKNDKGQDEKLVK